MSSPSVRQTSQRLEVWNVRKVFSGSSLLVAKKSSDPSEGFITKMVIIRGIQAPSVIQSKSSEGAKEDPYGWESRQKLIFLLHRKNVLLEYTAENDNSERSGPKASPSGFIFAHVFYKNVEKNIFVNVAESMVSLGFVSVKDAKGTVSRGKSEHRPTFDDILLPQVSTSFLKEAEDVAKSTKAGIWNDKDTSLHARKMVFHDFSPVSGAKAQKGKSQASNGGNAKPQASDADIKKVQSLVDRIKGMKLPILVEEVLPRCTMKAWLTVPEEIISDRSVADYGQSQQTATSKKSSKKLSRNEFHFVTICFAGIQVGDPDSVKNLKDFLDERIVQDQEIKVTVLGRSSPNSLILVAQLEHPKVGDVGMLMLSRGLVLCQTSTSQSFVNIDSKLLVSYSESERMAKSRKLGIWSKIVEIPDCAQILPIIHKGKVVEICPGFALNILLSDGNEKKFFFANIQFPQPKKGDQKSSFSFHSAPYMYECREFLRKLLIGHEVSISIQFSKSFGESNSPVKKFCVFTTSKGEDIAKLLLANGLAKTISREEKKLTEYQKELIQIESAAQKSKLNLFSNKPYVPTRFNDLTIQSKSAKDILPFFHRAGRLIGLVESLYNAGKFKIYVESQCCMIIMLLNGVSFPRAFRPTVDAGKKPNTPTGMEKVGSKALEYVRHKILQKEVAFTIEDVDRSGQFLGRILSEDGKNKTLTHSLLRLGYCSLTVNAEKLSDYKELLIEQEFAKQKKLNVWSDQNRTKPVEKKSRAELNNESHTKFVGADYQLVLEPKKPVSVIVTEISSTLSFWVQYLNKAKEFKEMMSELQKSVKNDSASSFSSETQPAKGQLCVAQFGDDTWYRCVVEQISRDKTSAKIFYIDYGNRSEKSISSLRKLPAKFAEISRFAQELNLAFISAPCDEDDLEYCRSTLQEMCLNKTFDFSRCYCHGKTECVIFESSDDKSINLTVVENGWASMCDEKTLRRLSGNNSNQWYTSIVESMKQAQEKAKEDKLNIWRYGCVITAEDEVYDKR